MRWLGSITDWIDINLGELWEMVRDSKPGVLQSIGSQGVRHNLATEKQEGHTTAGRSEPSCPLCPDHHIQLHCTKRHRPACGPQMEQSVSAAGSFHPHTQFAGLTPHHHYLFQWLLLRGLYWLTPVGGCRGNWDKVLQFITVAHKPFWSSVSSPASLSCYHCSLTHIKVALKHLHRRPERRQLRSAPRSTPSGFHEAVSW